ncbi:MAG: glucose-1-phosphate thymidylyltransferase [Pirellulales bacterium]|nr:glucose-1-phosphate thymidylyltransferase [Pirellulales bacterium]
MTTAATIELFEDEHVADLYPVSISRPAFAIGCGSYRLIDLVSTLGRPVSWRVRAHLCEIAQLDYGAARQQGSAAGPKLLLNAALVPSTATLVEIERLLERAQPGVVRTHERIAAAWLPPTARPLPDESTSSWSEFSDALREAVSGLEPLEAELPLFEFPHDIIRYHPRVLPGNLARRIAAGEFTQREDGVFVGEGATLGQYVVTDTRQGPIVIDHDARIGPYCYLSGPAYIGPHARVIEHSAIKDGVALGHTTKIGGEIEASVIEPYTNKQHHGFLGHSYLGSWINLGAGTCNSDLKNTYGQVNIEYHGRKVPTGMQFVGTIVGDYSKTAINTGIFTGKTIGTCSMVYGFVTTNVPSFVNYARLFGQVSETPVEVMIATQGRMFARRQVEQRACDIQLIRDMHELTRHERQIGGDPLAL